jgi:ketosteroid isomerase-like protein/NTP pyrophosphatase (non-canonical NTP hydrolase)
MPDDHPDLMNKLMASVAGLNQRFPNGNEPFQIITRLLEEAGELAQQVNHFEGTGVKREKYGEPDKAKLAKEVMDVMRCALQIAQHYAIHNELAALIERAYERLTAEGLIASADIRTEPTLETVLRFHDALNRHDIDAMMAALTDDSVFENTYPPPDGERYAGQRAVRAFWKDFFASSSTAHIDVEEVFASGDRCVLRWVYRWTDKDGTPGHMRGVDVFRVREGKVAEKFSYVKG